MSQARRKSPLPVGNLLLDVFRLTELTGEHLLNQGGELGIETRSGVR